MFVSDNLSIKKQVNAPGFERLFRPANKQYLEARAGCTANRLKGYKEIKTVLQNKIRSYYIIIRYMYMYKRTGHINVISIFKKKSFRKLM